jgi:hypothetical protein
MSYIFKQIKILSFPSNIEKYILKLIYYKILKLI